MGVVLAVQLCSLSWQCDVALCPAVGRGVSSFPACLAFPASSQLSPQASLIHQGSLRPLPRVPSLPLGGGAARSASASSLRGGAHDWAPNPASLTFRVSPQRVLVLFGPLPMPGREGRALCRNRAGHVPWPLGRVCSSRRDAYQTPFLASTSSYYLLSSNLERTPLMRARLPGPLERRVCENDSSPEYRWTGMGLGCFLFFR